MGLSTNALFTTNSTTGGGSVWVSLPNSLEDNGNVTRADGLGTATSMLNFFTPKSGAEVPSSATISNIKIDVRDSFTAPGLASGTISVRIQGGSLKTTNMASVVGTDTFNGNAAYWGLTEPQLHEFATGARYFQLYCTESSGIDYFNILWAKTEFTWVGGIVAPAALF